MSRYNNQYGYYDPVGSQQYQPTGYTYQPATACNSASYQPATNSSNYQYGSSNTYSNDQYSASHAPRANTSATRAAAALSSLSNQNYSQSSSSGRSATQATYNTESWYTPNSTANTYVSSSSGLANRSQSNTYAGTQGASTFGRLSVPEQSQTQNTASTFAAPSSYPSAASQPASNAYQQGYQQQSQAQSQQPPRYNSPFEAVQAQSHGHSKQASRTSDYKPSPQMTQAAHATQQPSRGQSASVEPPPTTVNPSQVYDNRAELQRKAQIEAEKRKKYEAEQAAKKAEEERVEAERRKAEEDKQKADKEAAKKADAERRKKAREEKKQSKSAAIALQNMTSAANNAPPANDEEAEMRAMFQKMREFNAKNPAMLAKLWEEERKMHAQPSTSSAADASTSAKAKSKENSASVAPPSAASPTSSLVVRPFQPAESAKAPKAPKAPKPTAAPAAAAQPAMSTPKPAQQPTPTSNSGSLWPPHKKGTLAEATAKWLMSQPQNASMTVSPKAVLNILDSNPSYVQLCENLESMGLKFERSALARELLRAVPDGMKAQTAKSGILQNAGPAAASNANTTRYEAPLSLSDAARDVNSMNRTAVSPTYAISPTVPLSQSAQPEIKSEVKPEEPPRPPANKEEAARKRTFGDLVDLTAEDSEEEPPPKKIATTTSAPLNVQQPSGFLNQHASNAASLHFKQYQYQAPTQPGLTAFQAPAFGPPEFQHQTNGVPHPPVQQPPVVPSQPPSRPKGPSAEQLQHNRLKGKMLVEPIMRDRVARKSRYDSRTIARDVLLATGRHPDMRGLNAHLNSMQKLLASHGGDTDSGGVRADLGTVRWDIIDPEPDREKRPRSSGSAKAVEVDTLGEKMTAAARAIAPPATSSAVDKSAHAPVVVGPKKRGRPSKYSLDGSKSTKSPLTNGDARLGENGTPRQSATPDPNTQARLATPSSAPTTSAIRRTDDEMSSGKTPVGYSQFNSTVINEDGTVVKKKGRPFGWRKSVHSREAHGLAPAAAPARPKDHVDGRVKKDKSQVQVEPQYQIYRCEWSGCKAELHNLETLKKHIIQVHGKPNEEDGVYECWWRACWLQNGNDVDTKSFEKIEDWLKHVDEEHLRPIAWKLGDGPKVRDPSSPATGTPAYLLDKNGRSITPIISPPPPKQPKDAASAAAGATAQDENTEPKPSPQKLGRGRPPKDGVAKASKAERDLNAPLKELEQHQRIVGPTMDRMGCVLANDERRRAFLDDEDFEDEVDGSDYDDGGMKFD